VGAGCGVLGAWIGVLGEGLNHRLGVGLSGLSLGFILISLGIYGLMRKIAWWPLVPAWMLACCAGLLLFTQAGILDYVFFLGGGLGAFLVVVGYAKRLAGLIISGCLLLGIGPGIAFAWGDNLAEMKALARTGTMLVWFSLGWALITLTSRIAFQKFVWWPLIPGGILAVVGWGLYIGGNPGNAVSFIGNTGSIVMIIFGLYLLLMRRGIRR
jgi:hypothetical protein